MNQININRKRYPNFSPNEEEILISLIEKYRDVVENKKTDGITWHKKKKVWEKIHKEFEMMNGIKRETKNLRMKYENLKKKTRKDLCSGQEKRIYLDNTTKRLAALISGSNSNTYDTPENAVTKNMDEHNDITIDPLDSMTTGVIKDEFIVHETSDDEMYENTSCSWNPMNLKKQRTNNFQIEQDDLYIDKRNLANLRKEFLVNEEKRAQEKHEWERVEKEAKLKLLYLEIDIKTKELNMLK